MFFSNTLKIMTQNVLGSNQYHPLEKRRISFRKKHESKKIQLNSDQLTKPFLIFHSYGKIGIQTCTFII